MSDMTQGPWADEARERWGETEAYMESARRAQQYKPADWSKIKAEIETVEGAMAALLTAGEAPHGSKAMDLAEEARLHITRWFYPCSHAMHVGLAEMYTADARFTAHYDDRTPGLAAFLAAAIRANAARHSG